MGATTATAEATRLMLARLWDKNLPLLRERLDELDAACRAADAGTLGETQREAAANTAHKLAGSLGMFGYPVGTELARVLEQCLDRGDRPQTEQVLALRSAVGL